MQLPVGNVEHDDVPVCDCCYRPAVRGFGRDMPSHEPVGGAGETTVSEESDGIAETGAYQSGGNGEHLTHARAAFGALVTNDHYIPSLNDAFIDGGKSCFFVVKHASGAAEILQVVAGNFYDTAIRSEISF